MMTPPIYSPVEWYTERFMTLLAIRFLKTRDIVYLCVLGMLGYLLVIRLLKELQNLLPL
ncbi:hypothetical protein QR46_3871 [Giardia duodenalis assemblage B]|uniref:Uncharacterized protein n=2 Tax=Giardia intestinalis TaxID=5741 RepID=A0A132NQ35_GIAIN|nr:Hypothetical protein GSB_151462 [Giardia intestinalis]KWX12141.1 hypothetical protein QR46_3871 [Giardia intestinalis assemblage B]